MLKVCKFGGSSVAGAEQFRKVRDIVLSDDSRRVVVISAAGKRTSDDHKLTDLLYLCHAHLTYGVSCADILAAIRSRFVSIRDELGLSYRVEDEFDAYAATLSRDTSVDELVSRGEYFTARLMAETLGYAFVDAADCVFFGFDGQFDRARTDAAIADALEKNGKIVLDDFDEAFRADFRYINRIVITACGSAYHAGCVGRYMIESLCRVPVEVDVASELRYRHPIVDEHTLLIAVSQSGETADTIAAIRECKAHGARVLTIVNVVGSTVAKLGDYVMYTWAGPEIAVATTKGYTTQIAVLDLLAVWMANERRTLTAPRYAELVAGIADLPERTQRSIDLNPQVSYLAERYCGNSSLFFIGRNIDYAVALEASLKLKEISYIHSEAYAAGELKHGTIALIDPGRLVVSLACYEELFDKTMSNIKEVKARGAKVLAVVNEGNRRVFAEADDVLFVPVTDPLFSAIPEILPLQLFAYHVARCNGCDIDKPRNLAKSVTVE